MPDELPSRLIAGLAFIGRSGGQVKALAGFKKGHHTLPDAANATTNAFLAKICEPELADEAERLFQDVRSAMSYKRKDIALNVTSPMAVLTTRDFTVEMTYALEEREPTRFGVTTTLRELRDAEVSRREAVSRLFAGRFTDIAFALRKGVRVEAVIDAIEALDGEAGMTVSYPSDYRECVVRVEGVEAEVRCTGAALEVIFSRGGAPAELIAAFAIVRDAFRISKALAGVIG